MELENSTVVLITDNPERAKDVILQIYKYVKKIERQAYRDVRLSFF